MNYRLKRWLEFCLLLLPFSALAQQVVVNEIMYHAAPGVPEVHAQEWIEIFNRGPTGVNLNDWKLSRGVDFTFPNVTLQPGAYLVVCADLGEFQSRYPGVNNAIGGWLGLLSNNGETIQLDDAAGQEHDSVRYASEGDWAVRRRGASDRGYRGWDWYAEHDGLGKSLELINSELSNDHGPNWGPSVPVNGTPGRANSLATNNAAPLITGARHFPPIPKSANAVTISATITDELSTEVAAEVFFRNASTAFPPAFSSAPMFDDGAHGDAAAGDGIYGASLPAFGNNTVIEFYLRAMDGSGLARTWPAPAIAAADQAGPTGQVVNALYQVDDSTFTGPSQPYYRMIMTEAERAELDALGGGGSADSDAQMNGTFISTGGNEVEVRYNCGFRNRGHGSRQRRPNNIRANFANDRRWKGVRAMNFNTDATVIQVAGAALFQKAGLPMANSHVAQVRINNTPGLGGSPPNGFYAANEELSQEFVEAHFPDDADGDCYRGIRIETNPSIPADFTYLGPTPQSCLSAPNCYRNLYFKQNNGSEDDWTSLIEVCQAMTEAPADEYLEQISQVIDIDNWLLYFACNTLGDNNETSLSNGWGDDYAMYRGKRDGRMKLMPYDVDSVFSYQGSSTTRELFRMTANQPQISRFINHPDILPRYYGTLKRLTETSLSVTSVSAVLERSIGPYVPGSVISTILNWVSARNAYVLSQIPASFTIAPPNLSIVGGYPRTVTSTLSLSGQANVIETRQVQVNGQQAAWNPRTVPNNWSATVTLRPGVNRILVQAFNAVGQEINRGMVDVWYDDGTVQTVASGIAGNVTWQAGSGPYLVTTAVTVPSGSTLTIEPGTTVYFEAGASLAIQGRLTANGSDTGRIRFTRPPGSAPLQSSWRGLVFNDTSGTNLLSGIDFEYAGSAQASIVTTNSTVVLNNCSFSGTSRSIIDAENCSLQVRACIFPSLTGLDLPRDIIRGRGLGDFFIIENSFFGPTTGQNDIINFRGGQRPGPILQVLNNTFTGASDDAIELSGADALIEGNIFVNVRQSGGGADVAAAIAAGSFGGAASEVTVARNLFYDCDYAALAKDGSFLSLVNNTIIGARRAAIKFNEGAAPGAGARLDGMIIGDSLRNFEDLDAGVSLNVDRSILVADDFPHGIGTGNLLLDPRLARTSGVTFRSIAQDFRLLAGSPAIGAGPNGLDMGGLVHGGASISGEPPATNNLSTVNLTVGGPGITHYRYRVNFGFFVTNEYPVSTPLVLTNLANGAYTIYVIGRNDAGVWQPTTQATPSRSWRREGGHVTLLINEVLARNVASMPNGESYPDLIELYNGGSASIDLGGMGITDDPGEKFKFTVPAAVGLAPGQYLVLFADNPDGSAGLHLGFGLNAEGDGVFLYDTSGNLVDSVRFGIQLADLSIGRMAGHWTLTEPTFGSANRARPIGASSSLRVNEWLTLGEVLFAADFVEVYNLDSVPVALGGLALTDAPQGAPARHLIAPLSFIAANGFTAFLADNQPELGSNHLSFRLSGDGGQIALYDPAAGIVDCIYYRSQLPDVSEGRIPSGASAFAIFGPPTLTQPTPGAPNPAAVGFNVVRTTNSLLPMISSWRYERSNNDLGTAWRAPSYNDSGWAVGQALLGRETCGNCLPFPQNTSFPSFNESQITYYFRTTFTSNTNLDGFTLTLSTVLDDGAVIYLNGEELLRIRMPGGEIGHFTLPDPPTINDASIETFTIPASRIQSGTNSLAVEVHNRSNPTSSDMIWGMALEGLKTTTNPIANSVLLNEVLANNGSVTNIAGTNTIDWIELFNPFGTNMSLAGMSLTDDLTQPRRWVFPSGVTVAANGYLLIGMDSGSPATTNDSAFYNTGFGLSSEGDAVYLFDAPERGSALLDSVVFGFQAEDLTVGRYPNATGPMVLNVPTPGGANLPQEVGPVSQLRINEWLANATGGNEDWFEVYNPHPLPVDMGGLFLSDSFGDTTEYPVPPLSFVLGGGFVQFWADDAPTRGANHTNFRLSGSGEYIAIFAPGDTMIDGIEYFSQDRGVSEGLFPDGSTNFHRFPGTETPEASNLLPEENIIVSEVLTHTESPLQDAIELQNISAGAVDVSGWFVTDNRNDPRRFRIRNDTVIEAGGFLVLLESQFNPDGLGRPPNFSLSGDKGDDVYLFPADEGAQLLGYRGGVRFGAAENGVSFGQYLTSVGYHFTVLSAETFGQSNAYPKVGPVVINEIMYHPPAVDTNDNTLDEFIELRNTLAVPVALHDPAFPSNTWRLRDAVDFDFPEGVTIPANGFLLVVSFDPGTNAAQLDRFKTRYNVPSDVRLLGPYEGRLSNDDENIELYKPDAPNPPGQPDAGFVPYVLVEQVHYRDNSPWPKKADGNTNGVGASLQRRIATDYGNDPVNWIAGAPTAGANTGAAMGVPPAIANITASPVSVAAGGTQSLTVTVTGEEPLEYQWRFNGKLIPGAVSEVLTISDATVTNEGVYTVLINNTVGAVAGNVQLLVQQAPVIVRQPQTRVAAFGGNTTFSVAALGSRPLTYQWQKDGTNIAGATAATLHLTDIQESDAGVYRVVVSNEHGSVTSDPAVLTLSAAPEIVQQPQSTNVFVGATATLSVLASGSPPLAYQWFKDNTLIQGATSPALTLLNLQISDTGNYTVRVTNQVGVIVSAPATVVVTVPPQVSVVAADPLAFEPGANTGTFTISRTGGTSRPLTVDFTISGTAIAGSDYAEITGPIILQPGVISTNIAVVALDDATREGNETVVLTISESPAYVVALAGAVVSIIDDDNAPPSVALTNPVENAFFTAPATVMLDAVAADTDGNIVGVDFFANGTNRIGEVTASPYSFIWTNVAGGTYSLTAVAIDDLGAAIASEPVNIIVNARPTVVITNPAPGASFTAPAAVSVQVSATDLDGAVAQVDFFAGTNFLGTDFTSPYSIIFSNNTPAVYLLTAVATDDRGATGVSAAVSITIAAPVIRFVDDFAARGVISGFTNFIVGTNTSYTREPDEPRHAAAAGARSGWLSWQAPASGVCTIQTLTNGLTGVANIFDTVLAVYTGESLATLTYIASNDDDPATGSLQSRLTFNAVTGMIYHIVVDGFSSGDRGNFYFRQTLPGGVRPTFSAHPQPRVVLPGGSATFNATAAGTPPLSYQWRFNGSPITGATSTSLQVTDVHYTNGGVYSVTAVNAAGTALSQPAELIVRPRFIGQAPATEGAWQLTYEGTPGRAYAVQFSTNQANWTVLGTNVNAAVQSQWSHTNAAEFPVRVYRLYYAP